MNAASSRSHAVFTILVEKIAVPNEYGRERGDRL